MKFSYLFIISFGLLYTIHSCKKSKPHDYSTTIRAVNKTKKMIDSLIINTEGKRIKKYESINVNDTTSKVVFSNLNNEIIFEIYINSKKYITTSQISPTVDPSNGGFIYFKGCFDFYLFNLDTLNNKVTLAANRDSQCN